MDILVLFQITLSILAAYYFIQFEKVLRQWINQYMNRIKYRILKKKRSKAKDIKLK